MAATEPTANPTPQQQTQNQNAPNSGGDNGDGKPNGDPAPVTFTQDQVNSMLSKVRQEEKDKLYPDLQKAKSSAEDNAKKLAETEAAKKAEAERADKLNAELQAIQDSSLSDQEKLDKRIATLEENSKLAVETSNQALEAARSENAKLRLELYKAEKIRDAEIQFPKLVEGTTPEEIDASVEQVKAQETQLRSQLREQLRDEVAKELGTQIPGSSSAGDDTRTKIETAPPTLDHKEREQMARLPKDQYEEARRKRLQEAKNKIPENSRFRR